MEKKNAAFTMSIFAILTMFMTASGGTFENPALQATIEAWPNVPTSSIRLMITIPTITSTIVMIFLGGIIGKMITYRAANLIALVCSVVGGIVPVFFCPGWTFMLLMRGILGIPVGVYSLRNALLAESVPGDSLAKYIGWGGILNSVLGLIAGPVAGFLTAFGWKYAMYCNLILVACGVVNLLWLKEPEHKAAAESGNEQGSKSRLPGVVLLYVVVQYLSCLLIYPFFLGISTFVETEGLGNAAVAGTMISVYMAGGLVVNALLPTLQKVFEARLIGVSLLCPCAGFACILFGGNIIMVGLGAFLASLGFFVGFSMLQVYNGNVCDSSNVALGSTLILAGNQLAVFSSGYYMTIAHNILHHASEARSVFFASIILIAILAVVFLLFTRPFVRK